MQWGIPADPGTIEELPEVTALLERGVAHGTPVVVHAPGGSGKSAVVARWLRSHPERHAIWLDGGGMLASWHALLQLFAVAIGLREDGRRDPVPWVGVVERLRRLGRSLVVVVDESDKVRPGLDVARVTRALQQLPRVTVVFLSRTPLRGVDRVGPSRLVAIGGQAFVWDEKTAARALERRGISLGAPELSALVARTDGRPQAIIDTATRWTDERFAARCGPRPTMDRLVATWYLEQAHAARGTTGERVLLATASLLEVPDALRPGLQEAVAWDADDALHALLAESVLVERASRFSEERVVAAPSAVLTELAAVAQERDPHWVRRVHAIAAESPAVRRLHPYHRAMSGEPLEAARLVVEGWRDARWSRGSGFLTALRAIPIEQTAREPVLAALRVVAETSTPSLQVADRRHHDALLAWDPAASSDFDAADRFLIEAGAVEVLLRRGQVAAALRRGTPVAEFGVEHLPASDRRARRALAHLLAALAEGHLLLLHPERALLLARIVTGLDGGDRWAVSSYRALAVSAVCALLDADETTMRESLSQAEAAFRQGGLEPSAVQSFAWLAEYLDSLLRGEADTAEGIVGRFAAFGGPHESTSVLVDVLSARLLGPRGEAGAGAAELQRLVASPVFAGQPPPARAIALVFAAELELEARRPGAVLPLLESFSSPTGHVVCFAARRGAAYLALGHPSAALAATAECVAPQERHVSLCLSQVLVVRAAAHLSLGHPDAAEADLVRGLRLMPPDWRRGLVALVPAASRLRLRAAFPEIPGVEALSEGVVHLPRGAAEVGVAGRLTEKESRLLDLLKEDLSLAEIAARLFVSINTVKSQARSLYRKLGVSSRQQAADLAYSRGLTPEVLRRKPSQSAG